MNGFRAILFILLVVIPFSGYCLDDSLRDSINSHVSKGDYLAAEGFIEQELKKEHDSKTIIELNQSLVSVLIYNSKYKKALEIAFSTIDSMSPQDDPSQFHFLIGCIFYAVEDRPKAIEYLELSLSRKDPASEVRALLMLSEIHLELDQKEKMLLHLEQANKIAAEFTLHPLVEDQIALQYHYHTANYEVCKLVCSKVLADSTSFLNTRCNALSVFADCLVAQDSLRKSAEYYESALKLTIDTGDPDLIKTTSSKKNGDYEDLGMQEKANAYHKIYNDAINDSAFFSIDKYRELYALEQAHNTTEKESQPKKKSSNLFLWIFVAIIPGIVLAFVKRKRKADGSDTKAKTPSATKIQISAEELQKIEQAVKRFTESKDFLKPNITLKSFCKDYKIKSERYLSHFINEHSNNSFSNFVNDLRISDAYNRIQSDKTFRNYKIEIIAKESGFGSRKTFERVFQAKYGQSPSDFMTSLNN